MPTSRERLILFATPVWIHQGLPIDNVLLTAEIFQKRLTDTGVERSIRKGWHGTPDLAVHPRPETQTLLEQILARSRDALQEIEPSLRSAALGIQAWPTILEDGGHVVLHDHAHAILSAVYWPDPGEMSDDDPENGALVLSDPRRQPLAAPAAVDPTLFTITPRAGTLVLFPGYVQHFVQPYRGKRARFCIAANIIVEHQ